MALFQPTNITPSDLSGAGTIDATNDLPVTWQVNGTGNTPMTAYKIDIMMNDTASTLLYSTGQVTLAEPFYGNDALGNPQYFTAAVNAAALSAAGVVNSATNSYKLLITQWWNGDESVEQSSASVFIARDNPTVSITNFESTISTISYTFLGSYSQAQGDPIEWARWQISGSANNDVLVDTGRIYGVGELKTSYDGFLNGNNYIIRLSGETINGIEFDTGWQTFVVSYDLEILDGMMKACGRKDTDAIEVSFPSPLFTVGAGTGGWEIEDDILVLPSSSDGVTWNTAGDAPFSISAPFSLAWRTFLTDVNAVMPLASIAMGNGILNISVSEDGITGTVSGQTIFTAEANLFDGEEIILEVSPTGWVLHTFSGNYVSNHSLQGIDASYASNIVTINDARYEDNMVILSGADVLTGSITPGWQEDISSVMLYGPQDCSYLWIVGNTFTEEQRAEMLDGSLEYDATTSFLALFSDGLSAGAIRSQDNITKISIYRKEAGLPSVRKIAVGDTATSAIRDYAAMNGRTYTYTLVGETEENGGTSAISSNPFRPCIWNYTLMLCTKDTNGFYHVQQEYRFSLDVASGTTNNNNNPTLQANFTRYPLRQPNSQNYRSGTLTAFVGKAVNGKYVDSLSEIDALREISTSSLFKFLKTRKGEFMMVDTASPITLTITDKFEQQPVRAAIPWAEIGDANGKSVITVSGDTYWPNN